MEYCVLYPRSDSRNWPRSSEWDQSESLKIIQGGDSASSSTRVPAVPEHLEQVFSASKEHLTVEKGTQLANC